MFNSKHLTIVLALAIATPIVAQTFDKNDKTYKAAVKQYKDEQANTRDWAMFDVFAKQNKEITTRPKAVLMGNSITELWEEYDHEWLSKHNLVGRGISGQVTSQMLVRFRQDVIDLKPECAVIMGGINDIGRNEGIISIENIVGNIKSMVDLCRANKIKPFVCSATPTAKIYWRPQVKDAPAQIKKLNEMLKAYCEAEKIPFLDYFSVLVSDDGVSVIKEYQRDAVHINLQGYKVIEKVLAKALGLKD